MQFGKKFVNNIVNLDFKNNVQSGFDLTKKTLIGIIGILMGLLK
jgi:hypothetical protein